MKIEKSHIRTVKNHASNVEKHFHIDTDRTLSQKTIKNRRTSVKSRRKPVQDHKNRRKPEKNVYNNTQSYKTVFYDAIPRSIMRRDTTTFRPTLRRIVECH